MTAIQQFTSSGTFNVPANVSGVLITAIGGGGGGNCWPGDSGGSGGFVFRMPVSVTPGGTLNIVVGAAGAGSLLNTPFSATAGGDTIVGSMVIGGGGPPTQPSITTFSGVGGNANGGGAALANEYGIIAGGVKNGPTVCRVLIPAGVSPPYCYGGCYGPFWGGGSGGGVSGFGVDGSGQRGAPSVNNNPGGMDGGPGCGLGVGAASGAGGASSPWGVGGTGGNACHGAGPNNGHAAAAGNYGCGGGGGTLVGVDFGQKGVGGDGMSGLVWVEY